MAVKKTKSEEFLDYIEKVEDEPKSELPSVEADFVEEVVEITPEKSPKFMYKATVSIRQGDTILSRASAMAERNNMQKDRPSVYSMAQTRALGKAYRMALSWIVKMADYEPTPAEEMPRFKQAKGSVEDDLQRAEANIIDVDVE